MPKQLLNEKITSNLLDALQSSYEHYKAGKCGADQYIGALKNLNDFFLDGIVPDDLKPGKKPESGNEKPAAITRSLKIRQQSMETRERSAVLRQEFRAACKEYRDSRAQRLLERAAAAL